MSSSDEDLVVEVLFDLAASAVDMGVSVGAKGGDKEEGVEVGSVDAEAILGVGVCVELLGEVDPVSGGSSSSGDDDELMTSCLEVFEHCGVLGVRVGGLGEEAASEADGDSHGSGVVFVCIYVVGCWGMVLCLGGVFGVLGGGSRVAKGAGLKIL